MFCKIKSRYREYTWSTTDVMCCVTLHLSSLGVRYFSFCFFVAIYLTLEGISLNKLQKV